MSGMWDNDILMERKFGKDPGIEILSGRADCEHQSEGVGKPEDRDDAGLLERGWVPKDGNVQARD